MKKMNIKEESSTNVLRGGTSDIQYKGFFHKSNFNNKKAQAALALAVSLWIGGAGVAGATGITTDETVGAGNVPDGDAVVFGADNITLTIPNGKRVSSIDLVGHKGCRIVMEGTNTVTDRFYSTASGAKFTVQGGQTSCDIGGAKIGNSNATGNQVTINGVIVGSNGSVVYGGDVYYGNGTAYENTVDISGNSKIKCVYGGHSLNGAVYKNIVTISGGTINEIIRGGWAQSASGSSSKAEENIVNIQGGTVNGKIYGGYSNKDDATGNKVNISGGTIGTTTTPDVYGGYSKNNAANNNTVTISGGTVNGNIWGGYSANGTVTGNIVNITGGTFGANTDIRGGYGVNGATNNTVNILKQIAVKGLYGGKAFEDNDSTGNTLNIAAKGVTAVEVDCFQNLNFYIPTDMSKTDIMLNVSYIANVYNAKVGVMAQGKLTNLVKNDKVTLLHAANLHGTISQTTEIDVPASIATVDTYKFDVTSDTNNIYATIT